MWKLDTRKMVQASNDMIADNLKGEDSRVPIDMWYRRVWKDQCMRGSDALNIIWEGILSW